MPSMMRYIPKGIKLCLRINPSKSLIEIIDIKNAVIKAIDNNKQASFVIDIWFVIKKSENSRIFSPLAPSIAGTAAKNENSVALCLSISIIRAPKIVAPERDVPGIIARA